MQNRGFISIGLMVAIVISGIVGGLIASQTQDLKLGAVTQLTDTINTFRTNVNSTDEALRSTTSTDPGHLHSLSVATGTVTTLTAMTVSSTNISSTNLTATTGGITNFNSSNVTITGGTILSPSSTFTKAYITNTSGTQADYTGNISGVNLKITNVSSSGGMTLTTPLSVPSGGTGNNNATSGALLIGNGVDPITSIAIGAAGTLLGSDGGSWQATTTSFASVLYFPTAQFLPTGSRRSSGQAEISVASTTITAGSVDANDVITISYLMREDSGANQCSAGFYFNGTLMATSTLEVGGALYGETKVFVASSTNAQHLFSSVSWKYAATFTYAIANTYSSDLSGNLVIDLRAQMIGGGTTGCVPKMLYAKIDKK